MARNGLVERREALAHIDDEDDLGGGGQGEIDSLDGVLKAFIVVHADAAGVDEREAMTPPTWRW